MNLRPVIEDAATRREAIRKKAAEALAQVFPLKAGKHTLELSNIRVEPREFSSREQKTAVLEGRTLSERIRGDIVVKDSAGQPVSSARDFTLMQLPYFTPRHTFIVDGTEYSVANQLRTKPGAYVRRRGNEELEATFNLARGANFRVSMDAEKGLLYMQPSHTTSKIPLHPVLRALGVPQQDIAAAWGSEIAQMNRDAWKAPDKHVDKLYSTLVHPAKQTATTQDEKARVLRDYFDNTVMDPEVCVKTLGYPYDKASASAMLAASKKLLDVHRTAADVDDRDSLAFKTLHSVDDFVKERIQLGARAMRTKLGWKLDAARGDVKKALPAGPFTGAVRGLLTGTSLSSVPMQINPMELMDQASKVTMLGEGAIPSERAIPLEARDVHPTHMGILDPARSPESFSIGVDLRAAIGARRDEKGNLYAPVRDVRTGKSTFLKAADMEKAVVAFPGENVEASRLVDAMNRGKVERVPGSEVTHQIEHVADLYGPTSNLLPLIYGIQGNRVLMASKHQGQALPLVHREAPLVQVESWKPGVSVEHEMVKQVVPTARRAGVVAKIDDDYIHLSDRHDDEKTSAAPDKLHYDKDFPLAAKTALHNTLLVKAGDKVEKDQPLAESNFTKDGALALGTNLRVAYMPYRGLNTNDGIVVSQGAADKLVSEHMYQHGVERSGETEIGREKHRTYFGNKYTAAQYANLDEDGVAKPGAILHQGDPIVVGVRPNRVTGDAALLGKLSKSLVKPFEEVVERWTHEQPGHVVDVAKTPHRASASVRTTEALQIGDKLCFDEATEVLTRRGWKPIAAVTLQDEVCTLQGDQITYANPEATHSYPTGGRMYAVRSQQVDFAVTANHQMYVKRRDHDQFELLRADAIAGKRVQFKKNGNWQGTHVDVFEFPAMSVRAGQGGVGTRELPPLRMPMNTFLLLLGAFLSEGNTFDQPGTYGIDITQTREPNRQQLIDALRAAGIAFYPGPEKIRIYGKQLLAYFSQFGLAHEKYIPDNVFDLPPAQLRILFQWLMWGDGSSKPCGRPVAYFTVSRRLADDVQRLCLHVGWAANVDRIHEGGPVTIMGKASHARPFYQVSIVTTKLEPQINHGHTKKQNAQEEGFIEDYARPVYCLTVPGHVLYVRRNGKPAWCGNCNRYGNKGVIAKIVPDEQMIHDQDGRPVDLLFTSAGIVSRINPAQTVETMLGKVAEKTGKPVVVPQYVPGRDNVEYAKKLLAEHGLTDKETVSDPITGKKIPDVVVGKSYILKLFKTTDSNWAAHGAERYDYNQQPARGGDDGAKGLGRMEFDGLVAHNARNILREAASVKSQRSDEFWRAVQLGLPTPAPKTTFAYDKFLAMLTGAGVKVDKSGSRLALGPLTDADIKSMSSGALKDASKLVRAKDLRPETGGLFDPTTTGGMSGTKWSHVDLHEPIVNPVFEEPVRRLLGLTQKEFSERVGRGGEWFRRALDDIDVDAKLAELREESRRARGPALDGVVKQIKYLEALKDRDLKPANAYVLTKVPVTPPVIRPILPLQDGRLQVGDANLLYKDAFLASDQLREAKKTLPESELADPRRHLYDAVGALFGVGEPVSPGAEKRGAKGYIAAITGTRPGSGFFQSRLMRRQQDVSGRATIAPDPTLNMDEIGVPEGVLWRMYGRFVVGRLVRRGYAATDAQKMVDDKSPIARQELLNESKERPVLVNRAPSLHRFNIIAAYPKVVDGKTLKLNPFAEKGTNADYDGDAMQIHAPVTPGGVEDAKKMTLSSMIFADKRPGVLNVAPEMESLMGLNRATRAPSREKTRHFASQEEAMAAYHRGEIALNDPIEIRGA
jgi:DNA-directed RNA polymerase beta subunit